MTSTSETTPTGFWRGGRDRSADEQREWELGEGRAQSAITVESTITRAQTLMVEGP